MKKQTNKQTNTKQNKNSDQLRLYWSEVLSSDGCLFEVDTKFFAVTYELSSVPSVPGQTVTPTPAPTLGPTVVNPTLGPTAGPTAGPPGATTTVGVGTIPPSTTPQGTIPPSTTPSPTQPGTTVVVTPVVPMPGTTVAPVVTLRKSGNMSHSVLIVNSMTRQCPNMSTSIATPTLIAKFMGPDGPHVGPMNLDIWVVFKKCTVVYVSRD